MAEIEKKYSDFQETECKPEDQIQVVDEKICPTCQPNPDFKLAAEWFEIKEAYLNEKVCEYHVRVYESEAKAESGSADIEGVIVDLAITKILNEFDKSIDDGTKTKLKNAAAIVDKYYGTGSRELGVAYLVAIPAFNFDQIPSTEDSIDGEDTDDMAGGGEFLLYSNNLSKKLFSLRRTLKTYGKFYSLAQFASDSFVIRQEDDIVSRINYEDTKEKLILFERELSDVLRKSKYPRLHHFGVFTAKRVKSLKFIFKDGDTPFELKNIYALADNGCGEYEKLKIGPNNPLRNAGNAVIYNFLQNLDSVYNDITAKETKPWLDWTLDHFYPKYIADRGNIEDINENSRAGLECLLEEQLGIGSGKVIDSLVREVMSAFDSIERDYNKNACRELEELVTGGTSAKGKPDLSAIEAREKKMLARYEKEYVNKAESFMVDFLNEYWNSIFEGTTSSLSTEATSTPANKGNIFRIMREYGLPYIEVATPTYKFKNKAGQKIEVNLRQGAYIYDEADLERNATNFATTKFRNLEDGSSKNQLQNSPHFHEAKEALSEVFNDENSFLTAIKDSFKGMGDREPLDLISIIGVCGVSKLAGKALDCLVNGLSFDSFLDILIDKAFDHMQVNTLSLFFNGLPYDFRRDLDAAIEEQFGAGVDTSSLFGMMKAKGGSVKLKDVTQSKNQAKRVQRLFEKYENPFSQANGEEKKFLQSQLGDGIDTFYSITYAINENYNRKNKTYKEGQITRKIDGKSKEYKKREKYVSRFIKNKIKTYKKPQKSFRDAVRRVGSAIGSTAADVGTAIASTAADVGTAVGSTLSDVRESVIDIRVDRIVLKSEIEDLDAMIEDRNKSQPKFNSDDWDDWFFEVDGYKSEKLALEQELKGIIATEASETRVGEAIDSTFITANEPEDLNKFEQASKSFEETALGVKVDIVFDLMFDFVIDSIMDSFSIDDLFARLKSYPAVSFAIDKIGALLLPSCPNAPIIYPPPGDFLKSLSVDICDPTFSLALPKLVIPSIDWRHLLDAQLKEILREAIIKLATDIIIKLVSRLLNTLEGALCNLIESAGGLVANALTGEGEGLNFLDALNEAFCNDGDDPATSRKKAEELADALFSPITFDSGQDPKGAGQKVTNIIGSVSSTNEILEAIVARPSEQNDQFNKRISNAVNVLAPEMSALLGSPSQVAYFFNNLGSHLSPDDRERIRDLLEADVPNLPISQAICLTNDELDDWNDMRNKLLQGWGLTPEDAADWIDDINDKAATTAGDIIDDIFILDGDGGGGGPFQGPLANEFSKDACNPNNVFNINALDEASQQMEDQMTEAFFDNISRSLMRGFTGRNGVIGEALADFQGRKGFPRKFLMFFNKNRQNSQKERDSKHASKNLLGQFVMDKLTNEIDGVNQVIAQYPTTVAITQRDKILEDDGKLYDFGDDAKNVTYKFYDVSDDGNLSYTQMVSAIYIGITKGSFGYVFELTETETETEIVELSLAVPVEITAGQNKYMESLGFQYSSNQEKDIRKAFFNRFAQKSIPLPKLDFSDIFEASFEALNKNVVEMLLTDSSDDSPDGIPNGYKFGYKSEDLTEDSFKYYNPTPMFPPETPYDLAESEKTLGEFGSDRITPLNPANYGGRYSNPSFYVEPRQFFGWLEIATKAFDSPDGCDPKTPPLISFSDIEARTKNLKSSLKNDPRLSKDPECTNTTPFHLLLDKDAKATLDGVIRTTIRTYVAEYFIKGYGLFSNLELTPENFDQGLFLYIANKIKSEMYDLGTPFANKKIRIARERYWYTFLEQSVEAYQRMVDVDGLTPSEEVADALNSIQRGMDRFKPIDRAIKKKMRKRLQNDQDIRRPSSNFDPLEVVRQTPVEFALQAAAYRLTTDEEDKETFFDGGIYNDLSAFEMRFASVKKLRFFQKIYFIALYEKESLIIMSELIRDEFSRMNEIIVDGLNDKPYYKDLSKSFFGMLPGSTSKIGLSSYYTEKQTNGSSDTGTIPEIKSTSATPPIAPTDEPQFIVESYAKLVDREDPNLPTFIRNRPQKYIGMIPLSNLSEFRLENLDLMEDNYLSDFFGDLSFTYKGSFKSLMDKGFTDDASMSKLSDLNEMSQTILKSSRGRYIASRDFEDFNVIYDGSFLFEGENPAVHGTKGSTGVKYGIRLSIVFPKDFLTSQDISTLKSNPDFVALSKNEKAYLFDDDSFVLPLTSQEIDVVDEMFVNFDPFSGTERYDLECLVNKMSLSEEYTLFIEKIFNLKQISSMLSVYCMETLMPSLGRKVAPDDPDDPADSNDSVNYERQAGRETDVEEEWDGTINRFGKNFLRREFKSIYLSRTPDGLSGDNDDGSFEFSIGNPFAALTLPSIRLPWWKRRKMKTKVYDANGQDCADPKKDLQ